MPVSSTEGRQPTMDGVIISCTAIVDMMYLPTGIPTAKPACLAILSTIQAKRCPIDDHSGSGSLSQTVRDCLSISHRYHRIVNRTRTRLETVYGFPCGAYQPALILIPS
ncbi:hypothetical protein HGRIS_005106 [Hohenbuehelia grisea]|uniref:Uncharacterized protein n=1 Tax=Hohenbuehelia grisea TaxID=104357 RepID=A0ABR3JE14_9AGAR